MEKPNHSRNLTTKSPYGHLIDTNPRPRLRDEQVYCWGANINAIIDPTLGNFPRPHSGKPFRVPRADGPIAWKRLMNMDGSAVQRAAVMWREKHGLPKDAVLGLCQACALKRAVGIAEQAILDVSHGARDRDRSSMSVADVRAHQESDLVKDLSSMVDIHRNLKLLDELGANDRLDPPSRKVGPH